MCHVFYVVVFDWRVLFNGCDVLHVLFRVLCCVSTINCDAVRFVVDCLSLSPLVLFLSLSW